MSKFGKKKKYGEKPKYERKHSNTSGISSVIVLVAIFCAGFLAANIINFDNPLTDRMNLTLSFLISLIALFFSMITYFSIDAVEKKNKIDNNVLQAVNYRPAYQEIMKNLNKSNEMEYSEELMKAIAPPKCKTCMDYTEWIQTIIDYIIFFAYITGDNADEKDAILNKLDKLKGKFSGIGSEINLLIRENISLIRHVFFYQDYRRKNEYTYSSMEDVGGGIITNPNAKIVYYDYLGLDYRGLAASMMKNVVPGEEFSEEYMLQCKKHPQIEEKEKCLFLVRQAGKYFDKALVEVNDDILWEGYIKYNQARAKVMEYLLMNNTERKKKYREILDLLDDSVLAREKICYLFTKEGYLQNKFEEEKERAIKLRKTFIACFKQKSNFVGN